MTALEPAPEGFEFDHEELKRETIAAFKHAAPELEAILGDLHWFCELGEDRVPTVTVTHSSGALVGTLKLEWHRVGFLVVENGS